MQNFQKPVIGFVAPSGSGKTRLLRKLVPVLEKRGLRVGYLKHAHHSFDLDVPGKDSYEIREAGARQTLLASDERWALQSEQTSRGEDPSLEEMLSKFDMDRLDLILVEGFKHSAYPKIEIHRTTMGTPLLYPEDPDVIAVVTDGRLGGEAHPPALPADDPEAVADFIRRRVAAWTADAHERRAESVR
jgi:molybdopterin-guanine dinucleotide biosynthesis protein B